MRNHRGHEHSSLRLAPLIALLIIVAQFAACSEKQEAGDPQKPPTALVQEVRNPPKPATAPESALKQGVGDSQNPVAVADPAPRAGIAKMSDGKVRRFTEICGMWTGYKPPAVRVPGGDLVVGAPPLGDMRIPLKSIATIKFGTTWKQSKDNSFKDTFDLEITLINGKKQVFTCPHIDLGINWKDSIATTVYALDSQLYPGVNDLLGAELTIDQ